MPTDTDKVRRYYAAFDEWGRLEAPEGALEFRGAQKLLNEHLPAHSRVLDLGGGPGRYAADLAMRGHRVVLADLSPELLEVAKEKFLELGVQVAIESLDQVNAVDLDCYANNSFDAALVFGPFYHLVDVEERMAAAKELARVLRPGGTVFVAYIARPSGLVGVIERAAQSQEQVSATSVREAVDTGVFRNQSSMGFQEAYYPLPGEIEALLQHVGFEVVESVSLKSIMNGLASEVANLPAAIRGEVERAADSYSRNASVLATSGHAIVVGKRVGK